MKENKNDKLRTVGSGDPFWSVMIPTYRRTEYLEDALLSVLAACEHANPMEIMVVDNASEGNEIASIVQKLGRGRIVFVRNECNLGAVGNWNECIRRARGEWLHILHDDDLVLPGFYRACEDAIRIHPECGLVATCARLIDERGEPIGGRQSGPIPNGNWPDFSRQAAEHNPLLCPGVVVRRLAYEHLGNFRIDLKLTPDWEMWARVGQHYCVVGIDRPLALYRVHSSSLSQEVGAVIGWCREIRSVIAELHVRQRIQGCPNYWFVYSWGQRGVVDAQRNGLRAKAIWIAAHVVFIAPSFAGLRWLLRMLVYVVIRGSAL